MGENGKHVSATRMACLSVFVGALSIFARLGSCQEQNSTVIYGSGGSGDGHGMGGSGDGHHMGGSGSGHHSGHHAGGSGSGFGEHPIEVTEDSGSGHHMGGSGDGHHSGHHMGGLGSGFGEHPIELIEGSGSGHHIGGSGDGHHSGSSSGQGELPIELTVEGSGHHVGGSGSGFGEHPIEITEGPSSGHLTGGPFDHSMGSLPGHSMPVMIHSTGGPGAPIETTTTTTTTPTTTTSTTTTTTTEGEMPVEIPLETPEPGCCSEKTVGGIHYVLVGTGETEVYDCLDNCIYHSTIPRDVWQYCFKPGRKAVQCNDATVTPSSGHHHPTEGPMMDHGVHSNMDDHSMVMEDHHATDDPML